MNLSGFTRSTLGGLYVGSLFYLILCLMFGAVWYALFFAILFYVLLQVAFKTQGHTLKGNTKLEQKIQALMSYNVVREARMVKAQLDGIKKQEEDAKK